MRRLPANHNQPYGISSEKIGRFPLNEKLVFFDNTVVQGGLISRPPLVIDNPRTLAESMVLARFFIPTPSLIFRTEWRNFLQFDPVLLRQEDWDLLISAVARGFKLINLDTSQVLEHGGVRSRLSTQRHIHSATRFLEKNPGYLSPEAIAWFEDLNIRNPPIGRPQYISMILSRLAHKQVSKGGALGRLLMAVGLRRDAD